MSAKPAVTNFFANLYAVRYLSDLEQLIYMHWAAEWNEEKPIKKKTINRYYIFNIFNVF